MTDLNYETLKNKIMDLKKTRLKIEKIIENDEEIKEILLTLFKISNSNKIIGFHLFELFDNMSILNYKTLDMEKNKEFEIIVLIKENKPIFKMEHHEKKNSEVNYYEDIYSIYKEKSSYLDSRIYNKSLQSSNFLTSNITILDSSDFKTRQYHRKEYSFNVTDEKIISLRTSNNMYLEGENNFEYRLSSVISQINQVYRKINCRLENIIFEDKVKEYQIKRKKIKI